jgi:hypothetical protein
MTVLGSFSEKGKVPVAKSESTAKVGRDSSTGRYAPAKKFPGSFSTEIVTKRGNISAAQAEKAVRDYLRERSEKK